jgi:hypothetical protein
VGSLERRLKALEGSLGKNECPVCGHDPRNPITDIEVVWEDIDGEISGEGDEEGPKYCKGCGRQLEYVVTWLDLPKEGEERQS